MSQLYANLFVFQPYHWFDLMSLLFYKKYTHSEKPNSFHFNDKTKIKKKNFHSKDYFWISSSISFLMQQIDFNTRVTIFQDWLLSLLFENEFIPKKKKQYLFADLFNKIYGFIFFRFVLFCLLILFTVRNMNFNHFCLELLFQ